MSFSWIYITGWWFQPTPLKNDGVRQLGWWHSQLNGKKHVPKHQPVMYRWFINESDDFLMVHSHFKLPVCTNKTMSKLNKGLSEDQGPNPKKNMTNNLQERPCKVMFLVLWTHWLCRYYIVISRINPTGNQVLNHENTTIPSHYTGWQIGINWYPYYGLS